MEAPDSLDLMNSDKQLTPWVRRMVKTRKATCDEAISYSTRGGQHLEGESRCRRTRVFCQRLVSNIQPERIWEVPSRWLHLSTLKISI